MIESMSPEKQQEALEQYLAGKLARKDGHYEVPTALFVAQLDVRMPPLPTVAFYVQSDKASATLELLKDKDQPFSRLALSNHERIYILESDIGALKAYCDSLLAAGGTPGSGDPMPAEKRMGSLRRSAIAVVDELFEQPTQENITKSQKVVSTFVHVMMKDPKAYFLLTQLSSHDHYTLQHSVGTAVNCIILARKLGVTDEKELGEVGLAGLLHDIGKVKVKKEIINKNGPLDELEWEEMRQHSTEGYEIVKNNPELSERTKRAILEHHEDRFGTGYPSGLKNDQIDLFSRIVCICDIYNALTTNRSYSKARTPFEAFQFMREKLNHKIDQELFQKLVQVYGGKWEE